MKAETKAEIKQAVSNILENIYYLRALKDEYFQNELSTAKPPDVAIISSLTISTQNTERYFIELLKLTK